MTLVNNMIIDTGGNKMGKIPQVVVCILVFLAVFVTSQNGVDELVVDDYENETGSGDKELLLVGFIGTFHTGLNRLVRTTGGAMTIAKNYINNRTDLLPGYEIDFMFVDTNSTELGSIMALTQLWRSDVVAFLGLDISCETEAHVAAAWNLPMISFVSLFYSNMLIIILFH